MAGDNRRVDSQVLRDLANSTREKRDRMDSIYRECRSRVDAAPRRWSTGEWDGTVTFMRLELEQMDREQKELIDRAWKNDIVSAIANLPDPLPLVAWKFLLAAVAPVGLVLGATLRAAQDLVATVDKFVKDFTSEHGRKPNAIEFAAWAGGAMAVGVGLFKHELITTNKPWTSADDKLLERTRLVKQVQDRVGYPLTKEQFDKLRDSGLDAKGIEAEIDRLKVISEFRHIDQMAAERDAYGTEKGYSFGNADCAPASAAMALMSIGVRPPGYSTGMSTGALVSSVRDSMATADYKDGVNPDGSYSNSEHGIGMDYKDILNIDGKVPGVTVSNSTKHDSVTIRDSLAAGSSVVVSGNFNGRGSGEPWDHSYFSAKATNTNHVIAVTGYDPVSGLFTVDDPGRSASITVTADALDKFTASNGGAWIFTRTATAP